MTEKTCREFEAFLKELVHRRYCGYGAGMNHTDKCRQATTTIEKLATAEQERSRFKAMLPDCLGNWIDGSGGHRIYDRKCDEVGVWDIGLGFVCDKHKSPHGSDDDAWTWESEREKLEQQNAALRAGIAATIEIGEAFGVYDPKVRLHRVLEQLKATLERSG